MFTTATTSARRSSRSGRVVGAAAAFLLVPITVAGPAMAQEEHYYWASQSLGGGAYTSPGSNSALAVAADGYLLAAWTDSGDSLLRRSSDAGRSWEPLVVAADDDLVGDHVVDVAATATSVLVVSKAANESSSSSRSARYLRVGEDGTVESAAGPAVLYPTSENRVAATSGGYVALHNVYGKLVAVVSHDDGRTFAEPVELGQLSGVQLGAYATYDVAAVGDDVTVAWTDPAEFYSDQDDDVVMTVRSTDGGRSWLPAVATGVIGDSSAVEVAAVGTRRVVAAARRPSSSSPRTLRVSSSPDSGATWAPAVQLGPADGMPRNGLAATDDGFVVSTGGDEGQFYESAEGGDWVPTGIPGRRLSAAVAGGVLHVFEQGTFSSFIPVPPPLQAQPAAAGRPVDDSCPAGRVPSAGFGDVTAGAPHADSVDCVVWWKVAGGRSRTEYAPAAPVNRAQMATFIANAIEKSGDVLPEPSQDWFDDDNGTTHERNINRLAEAGVISGRAPGVYAPDGLVSRGAMAKFLAVSYEYTSGEELPSNVDYFADDNGHVLELFVNKSAAVGLAAGSGSGYNPGGDVRRDQMATFIARWLDLVVERFDAQLPDER